MIAKVDFFMKPVFAAFAPITLAACAQMAPLPDTNLLTKAASPSAVSRAAPSAPRVDFAAYQVTDPADWRAINEAQTGK